jgi:hypothetical protein
VRAPPFYPWYSIPDLEWDELAAIAAARDEKTAVASNTRYWRSDTNLPGLCGEWAYACVSEQPMNKTTEIWGQSSDDFPGVDVKASTRARHLGLAIYGRPKSRLYFLVDVDLERRLVQPLSYATAAMLESGERRDYGNGERLYVPAHELVSADVLLARLLRHQNGGD